MSASVAVLPLLSNEVRWTRSRSPAFRSTSSGEGRNVQLCQPHRRSGRKARRDEGQGARRAEGGAEGAAEDPRRRSANRARADRVPRRGNRAGPELSRT
jgi:hypothetical protein